MLAPAKLTISLRVTGVLSDGYHLIDAEMVTIDLADVMTFAPGDRLHVTGPFAAGVPVSPEENLVGRALAAVGRTADVTLDKRIPVGAGLGGGSADAAAVLRWAGCRDMAVAASLGADVPFCLIGGRARVTGTGDIVEPLPYEERVFTLLTPPVFVSTADVYRAWSDMAGPSGGGSSNDLERPALAVAPQLEEWREELQRATGMVASLAGSGSTWFVEGDFPGDGRVVVRTVPAPAK